MGGYELFLEKIEDLQQRILQIPQPINNIKSNDVYEFFDQPIQIATPIQISTAIPIKSNEEIKPLKYCSINHNHEQVGCNAVGICNYPYPKNMSQLDRDLFLIKYPKDMTPQDYIHWLYAHDDPLQLDYIDYQNYRSRNNKLVWENIQHIYQQTMTPFSSYHKMKSSTIPNAVESDNILLQGWE